MCDEILLGAGKIRDRCPKASNGQELSWCCWLV
jgi:hypothetical protein